MIKTFEQFKVNEGNIYTSSYTLIVSHEDEIHDIFYFDTEKEAKEALGEIGEYMRNIIGEGKIKFYRSNVGYGFEYIDAEVTKQWKWKYGNVTMNECKNYGEYIKLLSTIAKYNKMFK